MFTTAIVLAGGRGSRMNHRDKAWVDFMGKPLIMHVIDRIASQVTDIIISRNRADPRYETLPYHCVVDLEPSFNGPLAGIDACHTHVKSDFTLVVPCDTPFLPADLVEKLMGKINNHDVVVASDHARQQSLIFLAKTACLASVHHYIADGGRSAWQWLQSQDLTECRFNIESGDAFDNINSPDQLR